MGALGVTHAAIFLLSLCGFSLLFIATPRHQPLWLRVHLRVWGAAVLRTLGFLFLLSGFAVAACGLGWGYGAVTWFGWLTATALVVILANLARRAWQRPDEAIQ